MIADTVLVARCLGIRYVWIDSLSIIQDDEQNWGVEAAKIRQVYAGLYNFYNTAKWISQIKMAPLSKRAWVHQEWLLSQRTVHFAKDEILWRYREAFASESFPCGILARDETDL